MTESTILSYMSHDHRECDALLAQAEETVQAENETLAKEQLQEFTYRMDLHFRREEKILFPAFEEETGMFQGPTTVMKMEHDQMRTVFGQIGNALANNDLDQIEGILETLVILMQQHNAKEEQILYSGCDESISNGADIIEKMKALT